MDAQTMKEIIIDESRHLAREQHLKILKMVREHVSAIKEGNDGTSIYLDKLPPTLINDIYEYIRHFLKL